MTLPPNPVQTKWLFELAFSSVVRKKSDYNNAGYRDALQRTGLIAYERRGRAEHVLLTDAGWQWVRRNLDAPLGNQQKTNSLSEALLRAVGRYLDRTGVALADFITSHQFEGPKKPPQSSDLSGGQSTQEPPELTEPDANEALHDRIYTTAFSIGGGTLRRVRIADLRAKLPEVDRATLDAALMSLQRAGTIELFRFEDPAEKTAADDAAALTFGGRPHQILYLRS